MANFNSYQHYDFVAEANKAREAVRANKVSLMKRAIAETESLCRSYQSDWMTPERLDQNIRSAWSDLNAIIIRVQDDLKMTWNTDQIAQLGFGGGLQKANWN